MVMLHHSLDIRQDRFPDSFLQHRNRVHQDRVYCRMRQVGRCQALRYLAATRDWLKVMPRAADLPYHLEENHLQEGWVGRWPRRSTLLVEQTCCTVQLEKCWENQGLAAVGWARSWLHRDRKSVQPPSLVAEPLDLG
ncbi:MAG TPA: hypothetical protein DDW52_07645 [Planctomycetaceae bacterium]|nr:hypothetical protein [Planctomycetaceae bacterium]